MEVVTGFINEWSTPLVLALTALFWYFDVKAQAMQAIAATNEVMAKAGKLTSDQALTMAAEYMGKFKFLAWIPIGIRKWIIQMAFDQMKAAIKKQAKK